MEKGIKNLRVADIIVVVFFLFTAVLGLYLFRIDLYRTLEARDEDPAGFIVIRNNIIQRRYADRTIWDRLFVDSPVYSGDLIRAADLSAATVYLDDNQINLFENTLIRIQHSPDGKGPVQVELREGNISVVTGTEGLGIMLDLMGRQIQAGWGTVLNAINGEDGIVVQVNEGIASFVKDGNVRELVEGMMFAQGINGQERNIPAAVVMNPKPNARYLKSRPEPLAVNFNWNRINLDNGERLRLEIAADPHFTRDRGFIDDLDNQAQVNFNAGLWYWRIMFEDAVLGKGQLTIADASGPELQSPVMNTMFRYQKELPRLRFQWSQKPEAVQYILEIADTADFINPRISKQVSAVSYIQPNMEAGTWYWRVQPVFASAYEGDSAYSSTAVFKIEQTNDSFAPPIEISGKALAVIPEIVTPVPAVTAPENTMVRVQPPAPAEPIIPVPVENKTVGGQQYIVQKGDTLNEIAGRLYGNAALWREIVAVNDIPNPDLIEIGDVLIIPEL